MGLTLAQRYTISAGAVRTISVDLSSELADSETLTGTPGFTEVGSSDLTFSGQSITTGSMTILGTSAAAGTVAQASVSGSAAGNTYEITVSATTTASIAQTLPYRFFLDCV